MDDVALFYGGYRKFSVFRMSEIKNLDFTLDFL